MPRFVVHEHDATRLHWDFRLEMDGVLKSWAVPKGPPIEPGVKRLAVEVEDHPLDYIDFEGVIEEGYGAGTVEIWDRGTYELDKREEKYLAFHLNGAQLKGRYKMIFTGYGGGKGWLLIKGKEKPAEPEGPALPEGPVEAAAEGAASADPSAAKAKKKAKTKRSRKAGKTKRKR